MDRHLVPLLVLSTHLSHLDSFIVPSLLRKGQEFLCALQMLMLLTDPTSNYLIVNLSFNFDTSSDDDVDEIQAPISEPASAAANQSTPLAMIRIFNLYMTRPLMHA